MSDIIERLHTIRAHLRTGALGQREVWEAWLTEAADEIERQQRDYDDLESRYLDLLAEIERLRAVITRAKDALLDGQSTQWVHDLLVAELVRRALEPKS